MLAKIHMIKLFFNRALKHVDGIQPLPRLNGECVVKAFKEMREEYEDDGLFDEMIEFFLPLTVTEDELRWDASALDQSRKQKEMLETQHRNQFDKLKDEVKELNKNLEEWKKELSDLQKQRKRISTEYQENKGRMRNDFRAKSQLDKQWLKDDMILHEKIETMKKKIYENEDILKTKEALKKEHENILETLVDDLKRQTTYIDAKLVKPHRGFIMYGPPGKLC